MRVEKDGIVYSPLGETAHESQLDTIHTSTVVDGTHTTANVAEGMASGGEVHQEGDNQRG